MFLFFFLFFFFFNDTATTEIYTLSLHDALPIFAGLRRRHAGHHPGDPRGGRQRSEEHTSELQSRPHLVCRLLLEKKKPPDVNTMINGIRFWMVSSMARVIYSSTTESIFFFNDTATNEIYTLSLHDALPISRRNPATVRSLLAIGGRMIREELVFVARSEEHTSELQSRPHLVCRLLLEK